MFAEPLSCCLNALELGGVGEGDVLGIWGAGPAGTLLSRAGALRGAAAVVIEPDERAPRPGRRPRGAARPLVDVAIVAVGEPEAYGKPSRPSLRAAASWCSPACCPTRTTLRTSVSTASTTTSTPWSAPTAAASATARPRWTLLAGGGLRVDDLISHRLPLGDLERGLDIVARRTGMKVHLYPDPALIPERSSL